MSTVCFFVTPFNYSARYPANSVSGATLVETDILKSGEINNKKKLREKGKGKWGLEIERLFKG